LTGLCGSFMDIFPSRFPHQSCDWKLYKVNNIKMSPTSRRNYGRNHNSKCGGTEVPLFNKINNHVFGYLGMCMHNIWSWQKKKKSMRFEPNKIYLRCYLHVINILTNGYRDFSVSQIPGVNFQGTSVWSRQPDKISAHLYISANNIRVYSYNKLAACQPFKIYI